MDIALTVSTPSSAKLANACVLLVRIRDMWHCYDMATVCALLRSHLQQGFHILVALCALLRIGSNHGRSVLHLSICLSLRQ